MTTEGEEIKHRGIQRYPFASQRTFSLDVIAFDQPVRTEHVVRIMDFSVVGVGIESNEQLMPGLVCFREPVGGQKFGVVIWCQPRDDQHRAGIRFVILTSEEEAYLQEQIKQTLPFRTLQDPDNIMASLLESIRNETSG